MKSENSMAGGSRRKIRRRKSRSRKTRSKRKQKGGFMSDAVNLLRYGKYETGSTWNEFQGYDKPVNPLPWSDQYKGATHKNFTSISSAAAVIFFWLPIIPLIRKFMLLKTDFSFSFSSFKFPSIEKSLFL